MSLFRRNRTTEPPAAGTLRLAPYTVAILRCPTCRTTLTRVDDGSAADMVCEQQHRWPIVAGVPVFSEVGRDVEVRPQEHETNQPSPTIFEHFSGAAKPWLHLGAGASNAPAPNSIELETAIFKSTDVVGDVHHLPFADGSLGGVLALNVFEHLSNPDRAAAELHRCLAPGAKVVVQTAFLQPLHADPYHFFNATETGIRRWFEHFDIETVWVPGNFNPVFALSWMTSDLLFGSGESPALANLTLGQLAAFWRDPSSHQGPAWEAFMSLPDASQRTLAAGFEIIATRPTSAEGAPS